MRGKTTRRTIRHLRPSPPPRLGPGGTPLQGEAPEAPREQFVTIPYVTLIDHVKICSFFVYRYRYRFSDTVPYCILHLLQRGASGCISCIPRGLRAEEL